jgi:hypothetical protein
MPTESRIVHEVGLAVRVNDPTWDVNAFRPFTRKDTPAS